MQVPHINIMFCTPGHSLMSGYVKSLLKTMEELNARGISAGWSNEYSSHVADARESTLNGGDSNLINDSTPFQGNVTYDKLMWIDSDITWKPEDVIKLYESDKDIISGAYLLGTGEVVAYEKMYERAYNYDKINPMTETIKVEGVGFGFVCIKSGVFEKLSRPWFQTVTSIVRRNGKEFPFPIIGEDLSFCARAREAGFEIWLDTSVKVVHNKMMKLTWEGIVP